MKGRWGARALLIARCRPGLLHRSFERLSDLLLNLLILLLRSGTGQRGWYGNVTTALGTDADRRAPGKLFFGQSTNHSSHNEQTQDANNDSHGKSFAS